MLTLTRSPSKKSFSRACSPKRSKGPCLGLILLSVQVSMQELQGPFLCLGSFEVACPPDCEVPDMVLPAIWGFPKIRGTFLRVPIIRNIVFWGLYWGPLLLGNYHILWY